MARRPREERGAFLETLQRKLDRFLENEIDIGTFPGAVYVVGDSHEVLLESARGHSVVIPAKIPASVETIYDVASLTKPLVTATLVLRAALEGKIDLNEPVSKHLAELGSTDKSEITFVDLLTHRGGFQAWYPLYTNGLGRKPYLDAILKRPLRYRPGTREIYSCLSFILLLFVLERIYGAKVEELAREKIFAPLGLTRSMFSPPPEMKYAIAATEWGNQNERQMVAARSLTFHRFRNYMIWGEVDDGNAYYIGGMGGNAGLFSTAREVYAMTRVYLGEPSILTRDLVALALRNYTVGLEENRGLGWQLRSDRAEHPSAVLSAGAFGHTGFTGTSVFVDPDRDLVIVLLTNRLHPSAKTINLQPVRRRFHQAVIEEWT